MVIQQGEKLYLFGAVCVKTWFSSVVMFWHCYSSLTIDTFLPDVSAKTRTGYSARILINEFNISGTCKHQLHLRRHDVPVQTGRKHRSLFTLRIVGTVDCRRWYCIPVLYTVSDVFYSMHEKLSRNFPQATFSPFSFLPQSFLWAKLYRSTTRLILDNIQLSRSIREHYVAPLL